MSRKQLFTNQPAQASRHVQEPTTFSTTETVVNHAAGDPNAQAHFHERSSTAFSEDDEFYEFETIVENAQATTPPHSIPPAPGQQPAHATPKPRKTLDPTVFPEVIPPLDSSTQGRTLILCFDGTGDQFDADNSNIVQLVSLLKKDDKTKQMVYYQTGIGTYTPAKAAKPWLSSIQKTLDLMFASSIHAHVMSGYEFLMQNYLPGDKICIFGFSRGAYTARSLAGMLHKIGLLPADNWEQVPFAYKMYSRTDEIGWEQSNDFKKAFSINVEIEFIGVWDTVDSVGLFPKRLPFTTSNTIVRTFRHAVALDERRAKFKANLWNRPTKEEEKLGLDGETHPHLSHAGQAHPYSGHHGKYTSEDDISIIDFRETKKGLEKMAARGLDFSGIGSKQEPARTDTGPNRKKTTGDSTQKSLRKEASDDKILNTLERMHSKGTQQTDIEEVWFAGCHCDVGGGSVSNKTRHSLARIPLRWMVRECFKAKTGIRFISERLYEIGLDPTTLYPYVTPRPPHALPTIPEAEEGSVLRLQRRPRKEIPIRPHNLLRRKVKSSITNAAATSTLASEKAPAVATPPTFLGSEEDEELRDALSPAYDQLKLQKAWWALEILPLRLRYQRGNNQWVNYFQSNMARPRFIPKQAANGVKVHRTVKIRMEAEHENERKRLKGKRYKPEPQLRVQPTWVD
ncbi:hypothetical protein FA15DRAFT_692857 [Coprinopsis marcescibilis]|uniref:T6SS Phospholipase effector Tle1-like catalytic domain-containing protein n=1 Tax=Coprinopsis marcescibilis TaxID=230819 RepID=A0A5C3L1J8_COPMA|nr:hypothetical protein FA15DRAFT_692857 [Coprinopsis marcescibilis]